MPYSGADDASLPDNVKKMEDGARKRWVGVWNSAFKRCQDEGGEDCEGKAFKQANGVAASVKERQTNGGSVGMGLRNAIERLTGIFGGSSDTTYQAARDPTLSSEERRAAFASATGEPVVDDRLALVPIPEPLYDDGQTVYRSGLVFRAGDYPDKEYAMTPDEIRAAATAFDGPVPIDLEHVPTVLDGKLGQVVAIEARDDGEELHGIVAMPKWLDQAISPAKRKVSATWNRETKQLEGLALVLYPRVADAALMAAFTAAHPQPSQENAGTAAVATPEDRGENVPGSLEHTPPTSRRETTMTVKDRLIAMFSQIPESELKQLVEDSENEPKPTPPPATMGRAEPDAEKQLREQNAALASENRRIRAERISEQAVSFADHYISVGRAFPSERDAIVQAYVQAATDDLLLPGSATFADGRQATRVQILKALNDARPDHQLTAEQLAPGLFAALQNKDTTTTDAASATQPLPADKIAELIGRTTLGQSVLEHASRGGVANGNGTH